MKLRFKAKSDDNQKALIAALRQVGASVEVLSARGVPDLLVAYRGIIYLMEVKGAKGKLTPDQVKWHSLWQSPIHIVRSVDDALRVIGVI